MNKTNTILNNNDVSMTITIVTPDIAKQWLKQNTNNRKIKEAVVDAYAKDMLNGKWTINNDSITFDKNGILTNGQHRLMAVIKSSTCQCMSVMYGVEHNVNMDRPATRSVSDNLTIFSDLPSVLTSRKCTSMVNFLRKCVNDDEYKNKNVNGAYDFIKCNEKSLYNFLSSIGGGNSSCGRITKFNNSAVLSAFYLAYVNGVDIEILKRMRHVMYTGEYVFDGYEKDRFLPIVKLDRMLISSDLSSVNKRFEVFLRTIYAINAVSENKNLRSRNKITPKFYYDFEYKGKRMSKCFKNRCIK